ncbi:glycoside hydrolase family 18 chitinase [Streptomyces litchfieldiae]|uniref:chitinase n=1 Tax=Streptomyces litchfieldiae TaxID=3075543 RepID=A0ABU2MIJ5_9ACTN|nr:glycoside hydrolase family 18 chitinase [Streptomyces sp. DSM 44938]MDT0341420.1 glycoside hydrolase family 18 chitinase [Streptomyces sp. DSM 44938]
MRTARSATPARRGGLRRKISALIAVLVLPLTGLVALAAPAQAATATATYAKGADWGSGFDATWTVRNTGTTTISGWTLEWDFPAGTTVTSHWDAVVTRSGNHYTARNANWNGTLAPGQSVSFGFNGAGPGSPTGCLINGQSCDGTGQPGGPGAPGTLTTGTVTTTSVQLRWGAASGDVQNYDVLRNGRVVGTTSATSFTDTGLAPATSYTYTVLARDTAGRTGPASAPLTVRTTSDGGGEPPGDAVNLGYFAEWGVYDRGYHVKDIVDSGTAEDITHINYAFGNVQNGECTIGDSYAAYDRFYSAAESVSGQADTWDTGALRGNFNQLRQLKELYPHIKVVWSFGGWTWSGGFGQAMQDPQRFAQSCYDLVNDPRWAGVFDGIDLDWEYPNACGLSCDNSGPEVFGEMMRAFRDVFGDQLVTAAITADASSGGKIDAADYAAGAQYADHLAVMTYDFFGAWAATGPTAPHSPLGSYAGIPQQGFNSQAAIDKLIARGVPPEKLLLGIGFYGRGWTGVTQSAPGGTATGAAPGTYEAGIEDYKVLAERCPPTGTIAGTAYAHCGNQWWSYDTPATIAGKMDYATGRGLGGAFFWELSGDTADGDLVSAMSAGLG